MDLRNIHREKQKPQRQKKNTLEYRKEKPENSQKDEQGSGQQAQYSEEMLFHQSGTGV